MREEVRPWLEVTSTWTGGHRGQAVFTLTAHTLGSLATGRKKLCMFLQDRLSITVENLRPPNRKNKKRTKKRAVERFEGKVDEIVKKMLMTNYHHIFHSKQSRDNYAIQIGKVLFNSPPEKYFLKLL